MLLRRAASLLSVRTVLAHRHSPLRQAPLLGNLLSRHRQVYTAPKAESSPPAPGERLAVLFPRGKRKTVSMEVKKRVLKARPPSLALAHPHPASPRGRPTRSPPRPALPRLASQL